MLKFQWTNDPRDWPKAGRNFVFLAHAFCEVGRALYPDEWNGSEALQPPTPKADLLQRLLSCVQLSTAPGPAHSLSSNRTPPVTTSATSRVLTGAQLEAASARGAERLEALRREVADEAAKNERWIGRRAAVTEWIADRARNGDLDTFGAWEGGGQEPESLSPSVWITSSDWELLRTCRIEVWSGGYFPSKLAYFVFVTRESLDGCLRNERGSAPRRHPSSLANVDEPLLVEMHKLIAGGEASGPYAAALCVVERAAGTGKMESRAKRLERGYAIKYGT